MDQNLVERPGTARKRSELLSNRKPRIWLHTGNARHNPELICEWHWPDAKGAAAFEREVETFKNQLSRGIEALATQIERANAAVVSFAIEKIEARRGAILAERDFPAD